MSAFFSSLRHYAPRVAALIAVLYLGFAVEHALTNGMTALSSSNFIVKTKSYWLIATPLAVMWMLIMALYDSVSAYRRRAMKPD